MHREPGSEMERDAFPFGPVPAWCSHCCPPEVSETTRWNPLGLLTGPLMVCMSGGMPPSSPVTHLQRPRPRRACQRRPHHQLLTAGTRTLLEASSWQLEHVQPTRQAGWKCWQVSTLGTALMGKYSNFLAQEWDDRGLLYAASRRSLAELNTSCPQL